MFRREKTFMGFFIPHTLFFSRTETASAAEIARGTVQQQALVCKALRQLKEQGWVDGHRFPPATRTERGQRFFLTWLFEEIVSVVE
jgi:predicted transcriptional regulator